MVAVVVVAVDDGGSTKLTSPTSGCCSCSFVLRHWTPTPIDENDEQSHNPHRLLLWLSLHHQSFGYPHHRCLHIFITTTATHPTSLWADWIITSQSSSPIRDWIHHRWLDIPNRLLRRCSAINTPHNSTRLWCITNQRCKYIIFLLYRQFKWNILICNWNSKSNNSCSVGFCWAFHTGNLNSILAFGKKFKEFVHSSNPHIFPLRFKTHGRKMTIYQKRTCSQNEH